MRIEIICTGDEVLSGKTVNTNYSHMAARLQEAGLDVVWGTTVGDDRDSLIEAFKLAAVRADAVIVNGGLGPTVDDLSQEVAAEAAGVSLELNEGWLENIEGFYAARGREMPPNNRKQAMLPVGSEFIDNPIGTACGFAIDIGNARFLFTPGVPREIHLMLQAEIIPRLLSLSGVQHVVRVKRFHSFGLGESRVDNMLSGVEDLASSGEVKLGFQAHYPQLETKLFARGADEADITRMLRRWRPQSANSLARTCFAKATRHSRGRSSPACGRQRVRWQLLSAVPMARSRADWSARTGRARSFAEGHLGRRCKRLGKRSAVRTSASPMPPEQPCWPRRCARAPGRPTVCVCS